MPSVPALGLLKLFFWIGDVADVVQESCAVISCGTHTHSLCLNACFLLCWRFSLPRRRCQVPWMVLESATAFCAPDWSGVARKCPGGWLLLVKSTHPRQPLPTLLILVMLLPKGAGLAFKPLNISAPVACSVTYRCSATPGECESKPQVVRRAQQGDVASFRVSCRPSHTRSRKQPLSLPPCLPKNASFWQPLVALLLCFSTAPILHFHHRRDRSGKVSTLKVPYMPTIRFSVSQARLAGCLPS